MQTGQPGTQPLSYFILQYLSVHDNGCFYSAVRFTWVSDSREDTGWKERIRNDVCCVE